MRTVLVGRILPGIALFAVLAVAAACGDSPTIPQGTPTLSVAVEEALDTELLLNCFKALEGKGFHGTRTVNFAPGDVTTMADAENFCVSNPNFLSLEECKDRVAVINGVRPRNTNGNPCLSGAPI